MLVKDETGKLSKKVKDVFFSFFIIVSGLYYFLSRGFSCFVLQVSNMAKLNETF